MTKYRAIDEAGETLDFEAPNQTAAIAVMTEWMSGADFDTRNGTVWYDARLCLIGEDEGGDETEEEVHRETMAFNPDEPDCERGQEHDWQSPFEVVGGIKENPGVWGHGGGVIIKQCCAHCGRYKVTDTWAQRSDTGEQGLESTTYQDADETSKDWVATRRAKALLEDWDADEAEQKTIADLFRAVFDRDPDEDDDPVSDIMAAPLTAQEAHAVIRVLD